MCFDAIVLAVGCCWRFLFCSLSLSRFVYFCRYFFRFFFCSFEFVVNRSTRMLVAAAAAVDGDSDIDAPAIEYILDNATFYKTMDTFCRRSACFFPFLLSQESFVCRNERGRATRKLLCSHLQRQQACSRECMRTTTKISIPIEAHTRLKWT